MCEGPSELRQRRAAMRPSRKEPDDGPEEVGGEDEEEEEEEDGSVGSKLYPSSAGCKRSRKQCSGLDWI